MTFYGNLTLACRRPDRLFMAISRSPAEDQINTGTLACRGGTTEGTLFGPVNEEQQRYVSENPRDTNMNKQRLKRKRTENQYSNLLVHYPN